MTTATTTPMTGHALLAIPDMNLREESVFLLPLFARLPTLTEPAQLATLRTSFTKAAAFPLTS